MRRVTREIIGVDRMATAWLIARFVDPAPEFVFVSEGSDLPGPEAGIGFDMPGARLSHRGGRCTFHTFVSEYGLEDPALDRLARIIDEADLVQEAPLEPAAEGLDMVCRGLRMVCAGDQEAIMRSRPIFEGLYAYLKNEPTRV